MTNHSTRKPSSTKRRRAQRRAMARLSFALLIAMVIARLLLLALDWVGIALAKVMGANIFVVIYTVLLVLFGWKLRGWIGKYKRRENGKCKTTKNTKNMNVLQFQAPVKPKPVAPMRKCEP